MIHTPRISLKDIKDLKYNSPSLKINPEVNVNKQKPREVEEFSLGELDNMSEISIDSQVGQKYYRKIEKLFDRSDREDKNLKNEETECIRKEKY